MGRLPHLRALTPRRPGLRVGIVVPRGGTRSSGNRVTARRWAAILRALGHRATLTDAYAGQPFDLLVALHARKGSEAVRRFRRLRPAAPVIVALTGTDVYGSGLDPEMAESLDAASRVVALQPLAARELPAGVRRKLRVVRQSASAPRRPRRGPRGRAFVVCVLAHLRPVKDPLRAAWAARLLPDASRVQVLHLGAALETAWARRARAEERANARYRWLGERRRPATLRALAGSDLLAITSEVEGGSNALAEALAAGVPVVSSRIPGVVGTLGARYPGYFPVGNTRALARLLRRVETDDAFRRRLSSWCGRLRPLVSPRREAQAWRALVAELFPRGGRVRAAR